MPIRNSGRQLVLFNALVRWSETFLYVNEDHVYVALGDGTWRPDFLLPLREMIIEVKGHYQAVRRFNTVTLPKILGGPLLRTCRVAIAGPTAISTARSAPDFATWLKDVAWVCNENDDMRSMLPADAKRYDGHPP